ncbi:MAG: class I SAM-dependent methyltransferase [Methanotrichaceae archaeon]|nr:class I SAM-dependent methyltransferase [Methanotrichaceae archaeon]
MDEAEFDRFAEEYQQLHSQSIKLSGESPEFFAEYKIRETAALLTSDKNGKNLDILDLGAGIGASVPYFMKYFPCCHLTCLDVSTKSLKIGESRYSGQANFVSFDGNKMSFNDNNFDLVFAAGVFHHIETKDRIGLFMEIKRILRPKRKVIIFEHNPYNPLTVHVVNACLFYKNATLIRARELQRELQEAGFTNTSKCYRVFFPGLLRALRPLESYLGQLPLGAQYYVTAEKSDVS